MRPFLLALPVAALLIGCRPQADSDAQKDNQILTGTWSDPEWGTVVFDGNRGTYTSTFGEEPGDINVTRRPDGTYTGTWGEGPERHGTLEFRFENPNLIVGTWTADPESSIKGEPSGKINWKRQTE